jgi:NTE family protein
VGVDPEAANTPVVALVLAGGGARGAYELGVLSELLPVLAARGERPTVIVGTSIGAMNAAYLAATAHDPDLPAVLAAGARAWETIRPRDIWRPPFAPQVLRPLASYAAQLLGARGGPWGLLDPRPTPATIARIVDVERLRANAAADLVRLAIVTTSAFTSETVVFVAGGDAPDPDPVRGITYRATPWLGVPHIQASMSIAGALPAAQITEPDRDRGWYLDGGVRLNTPIKPAIALHANRVLVVGLNAIGIGRPATDDSRPDLFDGLAQLVQGTLADPLRGDVSTLARDNALVREAEKAGVELDDRRVIPYAFVAPSEPDGIGRIAQEVFRECFPWTRAALRGDDLAVLGRLVGAGEDPLHGELFSYLFFAPEFTSRLLELGRVDARRWLAQEHDDGPWRVGPPPTP